MEPLGTWSRWGLGARTACPLEAQRLEPSLGLDGWREQPVWLGNEGLDRDMAFDAEAERRRLAERYARGVCEKRMLNDTR